MQGPQGDVFVFAEWAGSAVAGDRAYGPGGVAVSAFGYGYDAGGNSTRWTQSQPFHAVEPMSAWRIEQDVAEQLTGVFV
jgi:hypothetical protein